jgi:hypothetical protein
VNGYLREDYWIIRYWFVSFPYWQTNVPLPVPSSNIKYVVRFEYRTSVVENNNRDFIVLVDERVNDVEVEDRSVVVSVDNRKLIVPSESRKYDIG